MKTLLKILILFFAALFPALAADSCALKIEIYDGDKPARIAPVRLVDQTGAVVFEEDVETGKTQICDFGFGPHKLIVGWLRCSPTTIPDIRLDPQRPLTVKVHLSQMYCPENWDFTLCRFYLRVRDNEGRPLSEVGIATSASDLRPEMATTDLYGRVTGMLLPDGKFVTLTLTKSGYLPEKLEFACVEQGRIEREVRLRKRPE